MSDVLDELRERLEKAIAIHDEFNVKMFAALDAFADQHPALVDLTKHCDVCGIAYDGRVTRYLSEFCPPGWRTDDAELAMALSWCKLCPACAAEAGEE
jgi:hypothetical protein